jgi:hypothetical protein
MFHVVMSLFKMFANGYCYENRALTPSTFRPKPNLVETTELAYLSSRPILIADVGCSTLFSSYKNIFLPPPAKLSENGS